jgi:hypothetical protein
MMALNPNAPSSTNQDGRSAQQARPTEQVPASRPAAEIHRSSVSNSALSPRIWFMNASA